MDGSPPGKVPHLDEVVDRLVAEFRPSRVVLFGSWASGEAQRDSDIDLLVVTDSDEPLDRRMARASRVLRGVPVPVDVLVFTPAEVERYRAWLGHTVAIALRSGRPVYDAAA